MVSTTQRQNEGFPSCSSLVDLLQWRASHQPNQVAYRFLFDGGREPASLTYAQLGLQARAIAAALQRSGAKNDRALLLFPPGLDYISAWFGCLYASVVAVPAYPPRAGRSKARIAAIVDDSEPSFVLTTEATHERETVVSGQIPGLKTAKWLVPAKDVSLSEAEESTHRSHRWHGGLLAVHLGIYFEPKRRNRQPREPVAQSCRRARSLWLYQRVVRGLMASAVPRHGSHWRHFAPFIRRLPGCPHVAGFFPAASRPLVGGNLPKTAPASTRAQIPRTGFALVALQTRTRRE